MKFPLYVAKRLITTPYLLFWAVIFVTLIDVMGPSSSRGKFPTSLRLRNSTSPRGSGPA